MKKVLLVVVLISNIFLAPFSFGNCHGAKDDVSLSDLIKRAQRQSGIVVVDKNYDLHGKDIVIPRGLILKIDNGRLLNARIIRLESDCQVIGGSVVFVDGGGFYIVNSTNIKIYNLHVKKIAEKAESLYLPGTSAIFCSSSSEIVVSDCRFELAGYACGVRFVNSSNVKVKDCRVYNSAYDAKIETTINTEALSALDKCTNVVFSNNILSDVSIGISVWALGEGSKHCDYCQIVNNIVYNCGTYGIMAYQNQGSDARKILIMNNQIRDVYGSYMSPQGKAMGAGIYLQGCHYINVSGNYIEHTCILTDNYGTLAPAGIGCNNSSHVICNANNIVNSATYAMYADGDDNVFTNNIIDGAGRAGIYTRRGENIIISNNLIKNTSGSGLMLHAANDVCRAISVSGNVINLEGVAASSCISIDNVEDVLVNNNHLYSSFSNANAIYISKTTSDVKVLNNTIKVNNSVGINAIGRHCFIVGNIMDSSKARLDYSVSSKTSVLENNYSSHPQK